MKRIFIATNYKKLDNLFYNKSSTGVKSILVSLGIKLLNYADQLYYSIGDGVFKEKPGADSNIILLSDIKGDFNTIEIHKDSDFILHHSTSDSLINWRNDNFDHNKIQLGDHTQKGKYYYTIFKDYIFNNSIKRDEKANLIIDILFPPQRNILNEKLIFFQEICSSSIAGLSINVLKNKYKLLEKEIGENEGEINNILNIKDKKQVFDDIIKLRNKLNL